MRKGIIAMVVLCLLVGITLVGCGAKKAGSSKEAINATQTMETAKQKTDYLIGQAKAFYNSKEFQNAVDVAQYVLRYLDSDSQQAKDLLQKAKEALASAAKGAVEDVKQKFEGFAP